MGCRYTANEQVRWNSHKTECLVQALEDAPREALLDSRGVALWEHVPSQEATPNGTAHSLAADIAAPCQMWRAPRVSLQVRTSYEVACVGISYIGTLQRLTVDSAVHVNSNAVVGVPA